MCLNLLGHTNCLDCSLIDAIREGRGQSSSPCFDVPDKGESVSSIVLVLVLVLDCGFLLDCNNWRIREEGPPLLLSLLSSTSWATAFEDTALFLS